MREDWETISYCTLNEDGHPEDLPKWHWPTIFRPVDPQRYPDALPEPIVRWTPKGFEPAKASPPAPPVPKLDLTIRVYAPMGRIERPEVEVRCIRALRTARLMPWIIQTKLQTGLGFLADWAKSGEDLIAINDPTPKWEPTGADIDDDRQEAAETLRQARVESGQLHARQDIRRAMSSPSDCRRHCRRHRRDCDAGRAWRRHWPAWRDADDARTACCRRISAADAGRDCP